MSMAKTDGVGVAVGGGGDPAHAAPARHSNAAARRNDMAA
jgi:hypothetical protein